MEINQWSISIVALIFLIAMLVLVYYPNSNEKENVKIPIPDKSNNPSAASNSAVEEVKKKKTVRRKALTDKK